MCFAHRSRIRYALTIALAGLTTVAATSTARADGGRIGMMVDAGVPSGMSGAVAVRPTRWLRLHLGVGHNMVGPGVRGGFALRPPRGSVVPYVSIEAGQFARTDAGWLGGAVGVESERASLRELGYRYGAGHAGLEIAGDDATLYLELGASAIEGSLYFRDLTEEDGVQMDVRTESPLAFWTLSGRAGVMVWF